MASILDGIKMAEPLQSASDPKEERILPPVGEVRNAVVELSKEILDVKQVNVAKVALIDAEKGTWEVEADVYVPNETIRSLGLPVQKEVLDCHTYLFRLDHELNVIAYGLRDSVED